MENRERLYRLDGIIIRRSDYGEADRIVTVYTPDRGKLRLMAKGVRKITSRKAGHVELFMLTDLLVAKGRTWDIISQAEIVEPYRALREDLDLVSHAYYLAELIDRFTEEHDSNRPLFELLALTLARISDPATLELSLRYFELHLLSLVGYQPQLYYCLSCEETLEPVENNYFHIADGGTYCPNCGQSRANADVLPLTVLKVLRYIQSESWEKVSKLQLSAETLGQIRQLLLRYMTFQLERKLKSVDFLRKLQ